MDRLKLPGDSEYDVLGLSPSATGDDIKAAFHQLIDKGGFREGVPLRSQWQRAREIKAAHAILGDPATRAEYDQSLSRLPAAAPFASSEGAQRATGETTKLEEPVAATRPVDGAAAASAFAWGPASSQLGREARHVVVPGVDRVDPPDEPELLEADDPADEDVARTDRRAAPIWAAAGAAALAAGSLLYIYPPSLGQPERNGVTSVAGRPAPGSSPFAGPTPGRPSQAAASTPQAPTDTGSPQNEAQVTPGSSIGRWTLPTSGEQRAAAPVEAAEGPSSAGVARTAEPQARAERDTAVAEAPRGVQQPQAETSSSPAAVGGALTRTVILAPTPTQVAAASPGASTGAPIVSGTPTAGRAAASPSGSPARFLSGGPTNADNRRGRYRGTVGVQFTVEPNGGVSRCVTMRSSGDAALDGMTCRLVEQRVRYSPAVDPAGRPTASVASATYVWGRRRRP
jgi:protein TonB